VNAAAFDLNDLRNSLTPDEHAVIRLVDLHRLKVEQSRVSAASAAQQAEPTYGVFACLHLWQLLTQRMEIEGRGTDYHMVYEYLNELTVRDQINQHLDAMPPGLRVKFDRFVAQVDKRFRAVTIEDGGAELAQYWKPLAEGREVRWWWTRKPRVFPYGW
jgi:hypothetical protein